jgi:hypothetical protein
MHSRNGVNQRSTAEAIVQRLKDPTVDADHSGVAAAVRRAATSIKIRVNAPAATTR